MVDRLYNGGPHILTMQMQSVWLMNKESCEKNGQHSTSTKQHLKSSLSTESYTHYSYPHAKHSSSSTEYYTGEVSLIQLIGLVLSMAKHINIGGPHIILDA